jgi:hypothetical protein
VTYENYALAAVQIGDTASEVIWEYSNGGQWLGIARAGGAFTIDTLTSQFAIPQTVAQQLLSELEASSF